MIARLKGILEERSPGRVVVDVQGVGYGLLVPETVSQKLPETGQTVALQVHTHVREDHITLYGFLTRLEQDVFELLMTASGVGPKLALTILSSLDAHTILESVAQGNKAPFNGISGVGKKTTEKLFVEIREKAEKRLLQERGGSETGSSSRRADGPLSASVAWVNDLEQALLGLGYREQDVRAAVREVTGRDSAHADFDSALRFALGFLSGGNKGIRGHA